MLLDCVTLMIQVAFKSTHEQETLRVIVRALEGKPSVWTKHACKDIHHICQVLRTTDELLCVLTSFGSKLKDSEGEIDVKLAFGNVAELDKMKAARLALAQTISTITSLDELSDIARNSTQT